MFSVLRVQFHHAYLPLPFVLKYLFRNIELSFKVEITKYVIYVTNNFIFSTNKGIQALNALMQCIISSAFALVVITRKQTRQSPHRLSILNASFTLMQRILGCKNLQQF